MAVEQDILEYSSPVVVCCILTNLYSLIQYILNNRKSIEYNRAMRILYNYSRVHSRFKKTPTDKAGIQLDLEGNRVELPLIRLAVAKRRFT
jgi:hypothetical protein